MTADRRPGRRLRPSRAAARAPRRLVRRAPAATCRGAPPVRRPGGSSSPRSCSSRRRSSRVEPVWHEWMARWPAPADLAAAAPGDAVRAWGRLGYPRRALRLHAAAAAIVQRHGGRVPDTHDELLDLPGRRRLHRRRRGQLRLRPARHGRRHQHPPGASPGLSSGRALPAPALTRAETRPGRRGCCPRSRAAAATWNVAVDGARRAGLHGPLPAVRRLPRRRPVRVAARRPAGVRRARSRRGQAWHGTDRQVPRAPSWRCCEPPTDPVTAAPRWPPPGSPTTPSGSAAWTAWSPTAWSSRWPRGPVPAARLEAPAPPVRSGAASLRRPG